jgi:hypothetical protein
MESKVGAGEDVPFINGDSDKGDEDGLNIIKNGSSPIKSANKAVERNEKDVDEKTGGEKKKENGDGGGGSLQPSPSHSWISNSSSCANLFEDDDEEFEGDGGM